MIGAPRARSAPPAFCLAIDAKASSVPRPTDHFSSIVRPTLFAASSIPLVADDERGSRTSERQRGFTGTSARRRSTCSPPFRFHIGRTVMFPPGRAGSLPAQTDGSATSTVAIGIVAVAPLAAARQASIERMTSNQRDRSTASTVIARSCPPLPDFKDQVLSLDVAKIAKGRPEASGDRLAPGAGASLATSTQLDRPLSAPPSAACGGDEPPATPKMNVRRSMSVPSVNGPSVRSPPAFNFTRRRTAVDCCELYERLLLRGTKAATVESSHSSSGGARLLTSEAVGRLASANGN